MRKPIILLFAVFIGLESFSCSCEDLGPNDSLWYKKVYKNENYTLDSIIRKRVPPHDTILGKEFFYYYANGNLKNHEDYYYQGDLLKTHRKYLYEYDDENRMNVSIGLYQLLKMDGKSMRKLYMPGLAMIILAKKCTMSMVILPGFLTQNQYHLTLETKIVSQCTTFDGIV